MSNELAESLAVEINKRHESVLKLTHGLSAHILAAVNELRECGLLLLEYKEKAKHGEWQNLFKTAKGKSNSEVTFNFDYNTGHRYMKLARAHPQEIKDLPEGISSIRDAMIAAGALPAPSGHKTQQAHEEPNIFQTLMRYTSQLQGLVPEGHSAEAIAAWTPDERAQLKTQLEPIVRLYESI
jgi:hypothetical protein